MTSAIVSVRPFAHGDAVEELTTLLHRAYADHAAAVPVFFASHQTPQHRLGKGEC
jgi:hypothetical protein